MMNPPIKQSHSIDPSRGMAKPLKFQQDGHKKGTGDHGISAGSQFWADLSRGSRPAFATAHCLINDIYSLLPHCKHAPQNCG